MKENKHIPIRNIYYMLAYAFRTVRFGAWERAGSEPFENIQELLAAVLTEGLRVQLKQGLKRDYVLRREPLQRLRGRLYMPEVIKERAGRQGRLTCEFDDLSEDTPSNRLIKTAAALLANSGGVSPARREKLRRLLAYLSSVGKADPRCILWKTVRAERCGSNYALLLAAAEFVLRELLRTESGGRYRLASFLDDLAMSRLYEKFILEYYRYHFPQLSARAEQISWALDDGMRDFLPVMQSDVLLRQREKVLVIDAKYYSHTMQDHHGVRTQHSHNLYQIFTYVKNMNYSFGERPHHVAGMLLYAGTDEAVQPDQVYQMHGNPITVKTLNLNRDFMQIARSLNEMAETYFDGAAAVGEIPGSAAV